MLREVLRMGHPHDMRLPPPDTPPPDAPATGALGGDAVCAPEVKFMTRVRCLLRALEHVGPAFCSIWKECAVLPALFYLTARK